MNFEGITLPSNMAINRVTDLSEIEIYVYEAIKVSNEIMQMTLNEYEVKEKNNG